MQRGWGSEPASRSCCAGRGPSNSAECGAPEQHRLDGGIEPAVGCGDQSVEAGGDVVGDFHASPTRLRSWKESSSRNKKHSGKLTQPAPCISSAPRAAKGAALTTLCSARCSSCG